MGLNAIDGMLAREFGQQSKLGAILNELGDVVADTVLYLPLALVPGIYAPLIVGVVILSIISEMTGVIAIQIGAIRQYQGPMGKVTAHSGLVRFVLYWAWGYCLKIG